MNITETFEPIPGTEGRPANVDFQAMLDDFRSTESATDPNIGVGARKVRDALKSAGVNDEDTQVYEGILTVFTSVLLGGAIFPDKAFQIADKAALAVIRAYSDLVASQAQVDAEDQAEIEAS